MVFEAFLNVSLPGIVFSEFSKSEFFLGFENSESAFLKIRIFDSKSLLSLPSITSNQCKQSILLSKRGEVCFEPNKTFKTSFFENSESAFWEFENSDSAKKLEFFNPCCNC